MQLVCLQNLKLHYRCFIILGLIGVSLISVAQQTSEIPLATHSQEQREVSTQTDWLLDNSSYKAEFLQLNDREISISNGLIQRVFRITPNAATIAFDQLYSGESLLRGVQPEAKAVIDNISYSIGGLLGQPNNAFLKPAWIDSMKADPYSFVLTNISTGIPKAPFNWKRVRHYAVNAQWPPQGIYLRMDYRLPDSLVHKDIMVSVHYELYDGVPVLCKWLTIHNLGEETVRIDHFTSEILAAVEYASRVEDRGAYYPTPNIHVETDFAMGGGTFANASQFAVHWKEDPSYSTQVSYLKKTPCLLEVHPQLGPGYYLAPGDTFATFRSYILPFDGYDRERNGLAIRKMYRTIAPWTTENPLMMHVRFADWESVKLAIDQSAEAGFEMVILTFGSGFDMENDSNEYIAQMKKYAEYANSKGVEIGGYSLLASRTISDKDDVVMPPGKTPTFGNSPCLESEWGNEYFQKLYEFFQKTGFSLLEHDGNYPGDECISSRHPGHRGHADSRWNQWRKITDFYKWCRANGIYLNVPDYYFLSGSNKCAMGYREVNWSLPREEQVIHTRQNIYDGTWEKTPTMGWMFVPLTEYHGGGEAATIEPLQDHQSHYSKMLYSNLAAGVQACYRGPRLFDTEETKTLVQQWVSWYKAHREVLEADIIHLRRPDGRQPDYWLHVNPDGKERGMLCVFNPTEQPFKQEIDIPLYYTGLSDQAVITNFTGEIQAYALERDYSIKLEIDIPPQGFHWYIIE